MKILLWILLVVALAANAYSTFAFQGGKQTAVSAVSGTIALASAVTLFLTRKKR
ncbi:hypothetical protein M4914_19990 [Streptomyces somaliensis DSM 40738]|uniref:Uncharacterized protein n=1 Tax=Streptomyces somaliensis (strain ATCC 33201 / DSM 40738 / JCM 12659 / KCTC 9044 / NCTC 11332 / NRRL B-12077 / IP 733) TaxID=1134445 RepID=A0AA44DAB7_STRE0|nr:hypothetical protein [Streptomyces somaliensis]MCQ0024990.1 hypothetical protein [Streptomyces somaliensis DSM 40738]NKY12725.1 hypothetical protein [Streptomyces somaliensis DSM 40738]